MREDDQADTRCQTGRTLAYEGGDLGLGALVLLTRSDSELASWR